MSNHPSSTRWSRLDEALQRHAVRVARSLAPPASKAELERLLEAPWCARSVHESYSAHDGARKAGGVLSLLPKPEGVRWSGACRWLSIAEALDERTRVMEFYPEARARWFPIGRVGRFESRDPYEAEEQHVLVVDAQSEALLGICYHEYGGAVGSAAPLSILWSSYLDELTARLQSGSLEAYADDHGVLRLDAVTRRRPEKMRSGPAEALVEALVARDLLRLRAGPTEELLERVGRALRKRGMAARAAELVAVFSQLEAVEDFFVSEEELTAFLELF